MTTSRGFDPAYRTLAPGAALAVVAWSFGPMPFRKMHAHAQFETSAVSVGALSTCVFVGFLQYGASQPPTHAVDSGGTIMADDYLSNW